MPEYSVTAGSVTVSASIGSPGSRAAAGPDMGWEKKALSGFLVDFDTGDRLEFQFNPEEITDEKGVNWAAIQIPGMSHPRYQYVSGQARKIALQLKFFKGPVKQKVDWLRSLAYPEHAGTMLKNAPHRVVLIFGSLYPSLRCIVMSVKVKYFGLFGRADLLPMQAIVDIALEEQVDESINYSAIRGGAP